MCLLPLLYMELFCFAGTRQERQKALSVLTNNLKRIDPHYAETPISMSAAGNVVPGKVDRGRPSYRYVKISTDATLAKEYADRQGIPADSEEASTQQ